MGCSVLWEITGTDYVSGERVARDILRDMTGIEAKAAQSGESLTEWDRRTAPKEKAPEAKATDALGELTGLKAGPTEINEDLAEWNRRTQEAKPKPSENWRQNVTKKKAAEIDEAVTMGERRGNKVVVTTEIPGEGRHDTDGTIYLNPNAEHPVRQVLFHELTHDIETSGLYEKLSKSVIKIAEEIDGLDVEQYKDQLREIYGDLAGDGIDREAVASIASERLFDDERMVNRLFRIDQTLFTKIKNWLSDMKVKFFGTDYEKMIRDAEKLYIRAMETRGEAEGYGKGQNFGGTEENDYSNAVDLTDDPELADRIANSDKSRITVIRDYVFEMLGGEDITMSDGVKAIVDKSDAKHIANRARSDMQTAEVSGIREIIKKSQLYDAVEKATHDKYKGFRYYEIPVRYKGNVDFITVNVGLGKYDSKYHIYDLTKPEGRNEKRNTASRINGSGRPAGIALGNGVPTDSISNPNKKVNTKISQDSKGGSYRDMLEAQNRRTDGRTANEIILDIEETFENGVEMRDQARAVLNRLSALTQERENQITEDEIEGRTIIGERTAPEVKTGRAKKSIDIEQEKNLLWLK